MAGATQSLGEHRLDARQVFVAARSWSIDGLHLQPLVPMTTTRRAVAGLKPGPPP